MNHLGLTLVAGAALGLKFHFKLTGTTLAEVTELAPELKRTWLLLLSDVTARHVRHKLKPET